LIQRYFCTISKTGINIGLWHFGEYVLEEQLNNMLSIMNYSDAGVGDGD
jgi:hypothetical protein